MSTRKGRLVFIPEDSTWYEEIDELAAMEELYCLDGLNDLLELKERLHEGAEDDGLDDVACGEPFDDDDKWREFDAEEAGIQRMIRENDLEINRDIARIEAGERAFTGKLLWGLGGLLLGGVLFDGD